jgi:hypothetical protein
MSNQSNQLLADAFAELSTPPRRRRLLAAGGAAPSGPARYPANPATAPRCGAGSPRAAPWQLDEYLARRTQNPSYTFRQHLQAIGGTIEE